MRIPGSKQTRRATRLFPLTLPALLGGCDMVVMNPTGDVAVQQRDLILFSTGVMLLIIVPVLALTIWFAWKYRRGNPNKTYDPNFDHSTTLELIIWTCPLLIIIALSAVTWTSTHLLDPFRPLERIAPGKPIPAGTKPLEVQAVGMDWKWLFIYPDLGIATVNELALPVDQPVHFSITSTDQFNTFFAPTLAGMIYAMPTMKSELNAVLNKTGDSWGYSGNYTGHGYSDMRFKLRGVSKAEFDQWVAGVKAGGKLDTAAYLELAKPSEKVPVMRFSTVQPELFDKIVNQCVAPGTRCMVDVMRDDMMRARMKPQKEPPPGEPKPADPHHKGMNMSALAPFRTPGAPRAAQA
ncbi:ubiquinol oxidase subunit II [Sphingomonas sp. HITSZ_GF]|uniref:ubiquinol oxidase subunit II n=1 Tax=Sphingomonas sp. HITSZ_GF TaxID=3037247 RepID=UPI00240D90DF|nr:ubiquinol oxidase subunit II [Sphingomonas sp. HITSZ_GF]MDG2533903.1 ubiquinol oxidase subunit II [Sphingomonas sp. HITSZ_GF]